MIFNWKIMTGVALALALAAGAWYVQSLRSDNRELTANQVALEKMHLEDVRQIKSLDSQLKGQLAALETKQKIDAKYETEATEKNKAVEEVYATKEEACAWGNQRIPDDIYAVLCK